MRTSHRVVRTAIVALASVSALLGCTQTSTHGSTSSSSATSTAQPAKTTSTIYFVTDKDGKKQYLTANDPLVTAVQDVVSRQTDATDNRDAKGIDFSSEYKYYAPELATSMKSEQGSISKFYQTNKLATKHIGIFWFEVSFDPSLKESTVKMVDQFVYSKASASYYAKAKLQPTTVVAQQRIYSLALAGDNWAITNVEASNEIKQPNATPSSARK